MIVNYLKIVLRNMRREKALSFINITGLTVGITCFIILGLYVLDETGFDRYNVNADRLYRLYVSSDINGNASNNSKTSAPVGGALINAFPEIENYARIGYFGHYDFRYGEKSFRESDVYTADSTYFTLFTLPFLCGDPATALTKPRSIVLTEKAARKYFGDENPLGKQIIVNDTAAFYVTGVMKDFPGKSHFSCNFLLSMSTYPQSESSNWLDDSYETYLLFKHDINPREFERKIERLVAEKVGSQAEAMMGISLPEFLAKGNRYGLFLQPLTSIYLYSQTHYGIALNTEWSDVRKGNIYHCYSILAIGIFILLIAIFNFMNLSTARSESRAKEVGIRKTLGSDRIDLVRQFLIESTLTCLISVIAAYALTRLVLPAFNAYVRKDLGLDLFGNAWTIPSLIAFTLVVGLLSGSYPAFYLSSFQPMHILKPAAGKRRSTIRSLLVVVQFAISIALIVGTIVIKTQIDYVLHKDLGFRKDQVVVINNASALGNSVELFKQELTALPDVVSSTHSSVMFSSGIPGSSFQLENSSPNDFVNCQFLDTDYDFEKTYRLTMTGGRYFSTELPTDSSAVVVNEAAAKAFHAGTIVGKTITWVHTGDRERVSMRVIGVVKDFNYESLHQTVRPLVIHISPVRQPASILSIRLRTENYSAALSSVRERWREITGGKNFYCTVLSDNLERMYRNEERIGRITTVFSILAIFIACLGLFGLAAFITERRFKEIGIRKVLGASVAESVVLLSKDFSKWIILANVIAWPIAYILMDDWLRDFAYRIELQWWMFAGSGFIALVIALLTVGYHAVKAATANPAEALRYE